MKAETLLAVSTTHNGRLVQVNQLSPELQVEYLISTQFHAFTAKENKLWRIQNCYFIINKDAKRVLFKLNRAQLDFVNRYLLGPKAYHKLIILKARQLGFTTLIALWFLDEIIWNPSTEALQIAHTLKDAGELFNKKIAFAVKNLYPCLMDFLLLSQNSAKKVQFEYDIDGGKTTSAFTVSTSGRSGTNHLLHISELAKLAKAYPLKADEIVTGTLPSVPSGGTAIIESTAEGQVGIFYEYFMKAMERRMFITPELSNIEWYPVFYNWTWDDEEIARTIKNTGIIPLSSMKECEIDWAEYQQEHSLTDEQISFYYAKFITLNEDVDKLHQEYPTTELEAFIGSGSNYFSLQRTANFYNKIKDDYTCYEFLAGELVQVPFVESERRRKDIFYIYHDVEPGRNYVISADVAEGIQDGDYSVAVVLGMDKQIKAIYQGHIEPDEFSKFLQVIGKKYNNALLAVEFNKDGNWVNTDLHTSGYPNLYVRTAVDDITHQVTKMYGWLTSKKTRDNMLGEAKKHFNATELINCRPLLDEIMTFVRDKRGKPQAAHGKNDDCVIAWCIGIAVLQGKKDFVQVTPSKSVFDLIFPK